jgi:hypothetical protein
MNKELLQLELSLFGDWLCLHFENRTDVTEIDDALIETYLSERTEFATEQKERFPYLYAEIVP